MVVASSAVIDAAVAGEYWFVIDRTPSGTKSPAADILIHADPEGMAEPHGSDFFRSEAARTEDSA